MTDDTQVSEKTRQELRDAFPEYEQPSDEEIAELVDEAGPPDLPPAEEAEADGGTVYDPTEE